MSNKNKNPIAFRLTEHARSLIKAIAEKKGISQAAALEIAIRDMAEREKIKLPDDG